MASGSGGTAAAWWRRGRGWPVARRSRRGLGRSAVRRSRPGPGWPAEGRWRRGPGWPVARRSRPGPGWPAARSRSGPPGAGAWSCRWGRAAVRCSRCVGPVRAGGRSGRSPRVAAWGSWRAERPQVRSEVVPGRRRSPVWGFRGAGLARAGVRAACQVWAVAGLARRAEPSQGLTGVVARRGEPSWGLSGVVARGCRSPPWGPRCVRPVPAGPGRLRAADSPSPVKTARQACRAPRALPCRRVRRTGGSAGDRSPPLRPPGPCGRRAGPRRHGGRRRRKGSCPAVWARHTPGTGGR